MTRCARLLMSPEPSCRSRPSENVQVPVTDLSAISGPGSAGGAPQETPRAGDGAAFPVARGAVVPQPDRAAGRRLRRGRVHRAPHHLRWLVAGRSDSRSLRLLLRGDFGQAGAVASGRQAMPITFVALRAARKFRRVQRSARLLAQQIRRRVIRPWCCPLTTLGLPGGISRPGASIIPSLRPWCRA